MCKFSVSFPLRDMMLWFKCYIAAYVVLDDATRSRFQINTLYNQSFTMFDDYCSWIRTLKSSKLLMTNQGNALYNCKLYALKDQAIRINYSVYEYVLVLKSVCYRRVFSSIFLSLAVPKFGAKNKDKLWLGCDGGCE